MDENQWASNLQAWKLQKVSFIPVILPCGVNVFQSHMKFIYEMINKSKNFKCQFFKNNYEIPENGFTQVKISSQQKNFV